MPRATYKSYPRPRRPLAIGEERVLSPKPTGCEANKGQDELGTFGKMYVGERACVTLGARIQRPSLSDSHTVQARTMPQDGHMRTAAIVTPCTMRHAQYTLDGCGPGRMPLEQSFDRRG
jgi:hypothetical protein